MCDYINKLGSELISELKLSLIPEDLRLNYIKVYDTRLSSYVHAIPDSRIWLLGITLFSKYNKPGTPQDKRLLHLPIIPRTKLYNYLKSGQLSLLDYFRATGEYLIYYSTSIKMSTSDSDTLEGCTNIKDWVELCFDGSLELFFLKTPLETLLSDIETYLKETNDERL